MMKSEVKQIELYSAKLTNQIIKERRKSKSTDTKCKFNGSGKDSKYKYDCATFDVKKVYQKATIKPSHLEPFTHLKRSPINIAIGMVNEAIFYLLKKQSKPDCNRILNVLKYF